MASVNSYFCCIGLLFNLVIGQAKSNPRWKPSKFNQIHTRSYYDKCFKQFPFKYENHQISELRENHKQKTKNHTAKNHQISELRENHKQKIENHNA